MKYVPAIRGQCVCKLLTEWSKLVQYTPRYEPSLHIAVNNLRGVASYFTTRNDKITSEMEYRVAVFVYVTISSDFATNWKRNLKSVMQMNTFLPYL